MEDKEVIHDRMLKIIDDKYDKTRGSFLYDATKPAAIELEIKNKEIKEVQNKLDIENLFSEELERFIYPRTGQTRKLATKSSDVVIISGQEGSSIKKGDIVAADTVNFISLEDKVIGESGVINILVECEEFGSIGNVPANSINRFPITIPGLIDVYNPELFTNGYDAETDDELRQRYYDKLQRPGKAGNKFHYEEWAKEVVGVGGVRIVPKFNGLLTMKVIIIDSNGLPANEELINNVEENIKNKMPFGVKELLVIGAEPVEINISVDLIIVDGYIEEIVKENISNNVAEYLKSLAFKTEYISYAQIGSTILNTNGVIDYSNLLVNFSTGNVLIVNNQVAIMGVIE